MGRLLAWIDWTLRNRRNWVRTVRLYDPYTFDEDVPLILGETHMMEETWTHTTGAVRVVNRGRWCWERIRWGKQRWMDT